LIGEPDNSSARLLALFSNAAQPVRPLDRPLVLMGRADDCDVQLSSPGAPYECVLVESADGWRVLHLKETAKGAEGDLRGGALLRHGETLRVGPYRFRFEAGPGESGSAAASNGETRWVLRRGSRVVDPDPVAWLRVEADDPPDDAGRKSVRGIPACMAARTRRGLVARRLGGDSARVSINDEPFHLKSLRPGDRLRVGDLEFQVDAAGATGDDAPAVSATRTPSIRLASEEPADRANGSGTNGGIEALIAARLPNDLRPLPRLTHFSENDRDSGKRGATHGSDETRTTADSVAMAHAASVGSISQPQGGTFTLAERLDSGTPETDAMRRQARAEMQNALSLQRELDAEHALIREWHDVLEARHLELDRQRDEQDRREHRLGGERSELEWRFEELRRRQSEAAAAQARTACDRTALDAERAALEGRTEEISAAMDRQRLEAGRLESHHDELERRAAELEALSRRLADQDDALRRRMQEYEQRVGSLVREQSESDAWADADSDANAPPGFSPTQNRHLFSPPGPPFETSPVAPDDFPRESPPSHVKLERAAERAALSAAPEITVRRGPGRAALWLAAAITTVATIAGYFWPVQAAFVRGGLRIEGSADQPRVALRGHQAGLEEAVVWTAAAVRLGIEPEELSEWRQTAGFDSRLDPSSPRVDLVVHVPAAQTSMAQRRLDALVQAYLDRQRNLKTALSDKDIEDLRTQRMALEERVTAGEGDLRGLEDRLQTATLDEELTRARAQLKDLEALQQRARDDAERAEQDRLRLRNETDDSIARRADPEQLREALRLDANLGADRDQLAAQAGRLLAPLAAAAAGVSDALESLTLSVGAAQTRLAELKITYADTPELETVSVFGASLEQFSQTLRGAFEKWNPPAKSLKDWKPDRDPEELTTLREALWNLGADWGTPLRAGLDHLMTIVLSLGAGDDPSANTRRRVLQSSLTELIQPLEQMHRSLLAGVLSLSGGSDPVAADLRRTVAALQQRVTEREQTLRRELEERTREEWRSRRNERLEAAQRRADAAAAQRDSLTRDVAAAQQRVTRLLDAVQQREGTRQELTLRRTEVVDLRGKLEESDRRLRRAEQERRALGDGRLILTPAAVEPASPEERLSRAAVFGGAAGVASLLMLLAASLLGGGTVRSADRDGA